MKKYSHELFLFKTKNNFCYLMKDTIDVNERKIYFSLIKNENEGKKRV